MEDRPTLWQLLWEQRDKLLEQTLTHIGLTFIAVLIAVSIGVPLGILISRHKRLAVPVLGGAGVMQTIPSIALLGFMIPFLGIGAKPAIAALLLYALLPIVRNTYTGITGVDDTIRDAAKGMGMTDAQLLLKVELPLAQPVILAGIRIATVISIGVATLAAYIGAGGLGEFIFGGISLNNTNMLLAGAIPAAALALLADFLLSRLQRVKIRSWRVAAISVPVILLACSALYALPAAGGKLLAGFTPEFMGRTDGYLGLKKLYGMRLRTLVISDAIMYQAAYEKKLDVISGYSTDGRLKAFDLVSLADDKHIFPPYYAAPIVRESVLDKYPELEGALNLLAGRINDSAMTELNYRADYLKQSPEAIAKSFLTSLGLWRPPHAATQGTITIGSKIFDEQYILSNLYAILIRGYTDLAVVQKTGLGGTKICFDALSNGDIDLYPEYTGTGLLVILHTDPSALHGHASDKDSVYAFVQHEFDRRYHIKWLKPLGFNNTYALMMRRSQAKALRINTISELNNYLRH
jgi:osmoprotectant transport system permease protein